jgi:hypothetical protein
MNPLVRAVKGYRSICMKSIQRHVRKLNHINSKSYLSKAVWFTQEVTAGQPCVCREDLVHENADTDNGTDR